MEQEKKENSGTAGITFKEMLEAANSGEPITNENKEEIDVNKMLADPQKRAKLMTLIKTLSAMRLCKEDSIPDCILKREVAGDGEEWQTKLYPCKPKGEEAKSEAFDEVDESKLGEGFLYQGSVGAAYNPKTLKEVGITHILTCASNIGPRFPD